MTHPQKSKQEKVGRNKRQIRIKSEQVYPSYYELPFPLTTLISAVKDLFLGALVTIGLPLPIFPFPFPLIGIGESLPAESESASFVRPRLVVLAMPEVVPERRGVARGAFETAGDEVRRRLDATLNTLLRGGRPRRGACPWGGGTTSNRVGGIERRVDKRPPVDKEA